MKIVRKNGKAVLSLTRAEYIKIGETFNSKKTVTAHKTVTKVAGAIVNLLPSIRNGDARAAAQVSSILDSAIKGVPFEPDDLNALREISGLQNANDPSIIDLALKANEYLSRA